MSRPISICIVLDRSGSMEVCRGEAVQAVNSYLNKVRDDHIEARVTILLFDDSGIDTIRDGVPITVCANLTPIEFQPRGSTPLFDAIAVGVLTLDRALNTRWKFLAIVTDGQENASREYTAASLSALLKRRHEDDHWTVLYLGTGHATGAEAEDVGIRREAVATFAVSAFGTAAEVMSRATVVASSVSPKTFAITTEERADLAGGQQPKEGSQSQD